MEAPGRVPLSHTANFFACRCLGTSALQALGQSSGLECIAVHVSAANIRAPGLLQCKNRRAAHYAGYSDARPAVPCVYTWLCCSVCGAHVGITEGLDRHSCHLASLLATPVPGGACGACGGPGGLHVEGPVQGAARCSRCTGSCCAWLCCRCRKVGPRGNSTAHHDPACRGTCSQLLHLPCCRCMWWVRSA